MKKAFSLALALMMALSLAACGGSDGAGGASSGGSESSGNSSGDDTVYTIKLGTDTSDPATSPDFNAWGHCIERFRQLVEEKTNGRVKVEAYYDSVLGGIPEITTQVRDGELDMMYSIILSTFDSRMGFRSMPFVFRDLEQIQRLYANPEGEIYKLYSSYAEELGIHVLGFGVGNFRGLANRKHRVTVPGDLSDITMRIYEDQTVKNFLSPLCNATIIPFNEAYTAIQTGTCDGIEVGAPVINYAKFYEVCGYYTDINWQATSYGFHMSDNCWNMLPEDLRQIVIDCSWEAGAAEYDQQVADTEAAYAALEELGVEVYHLTAEERQAWMDYADTLADFFRDYVGAETYDTVKEIVAADSAAHPAA